MNVQIPKGSLISRSVVLPAGTKTAALDLGGMTLVGFRLPATFTGTAITFEASEAVDGTFSAVKKNDGSALSLTVAQGTFVALDPAQFASLNFMKMVSGSSEGADRTIVLILKGF